MKNVPEHATQVAKHVGDVAAASVTVATIFKWLPAIAAGFTIVWTAIRIYETDTVQRVLKRRKER